VRKKKRIPGSLSLSLSLSPPLEKRARGEVGGSWPRSGPTTPAVFSNHSGYHTVRHIQSPATVYVELYGSPSGWRRQPGWLDPTWANSLRPLLSLSSPTEERERERERESLVYAFFFALYTSPRAAKRRSFRGGCVFFSFRIKYHCICN